MRSMPPLILALALFAAGCSETPLSPTSLADGVGVTEPSSTTKLRWDLVAPGCTPRTPPSSIPDSAAARLTREPDGSITASWWDYTLPGGGTGLLYARFVLSGAEWSLCFWDTAGV